MSFPTLVLGNLDLTDWSGSQYDTAVIAEGMSRGSPVPIDVAVKSWLQDGSVVVTQGYDNREVTLRVRLRGPDTVALADAEAALFAELGKPNTLTWTPAGEFAIPSVFVVVTSSMDPSPAPGEDIAEGGAYPFRTYNLRLVCEAFVRSKDEVTIPALPASGTTTTLVDNGSATTNWTGEVNGASTTPAVASGAVGITTGSITGETTIALIRTASITGLSSTPYLQVDWTPTTGSYVLNTRTIKAFADGVQLAQISSVPNGSSIRTTFYVPVASIAALRLEYFTRSLTGGGATSNQPQVRTFYVDNINKTDTRPSLGTTRQQARSFSLIGSAPTPGSLVINHASNSLGDVLGYVWCDVNGDASNYSPAMRQYSGVSSSPDAATVYGSRVALTAGSSLAIDAPAVAIPEGEYVMLARCAAASGSFAGSLQGSTKTKVNSTDLDTEHFEPAASVSFTTTYTVYPVCRLSLPSVDVRDANAATIRIALKNGAAGTINLDEIWLFNLSIGELVWVDCGTGTAASGGPSRRVIVDPATIDRPRPVVLRGHATDGSDAFHAGVKAWGFLKFVPPQVNIFTVTTNTADADANLRGFPRWHSHAAA